MTEQGKTSPIFSVLLPITRAPALLPFAIESVLEQSVAEFELLIVCDGAPAETVNCAKRYAKRDARVRVFEFPKGLRHGEEHRDWVLNNATGRNVAQICDDDLWFPNHLEEMQKLLATADFGNLLHVHVRIEDEIEIFPGDLALPEVRQRMMKEHYNFFGLSFAGYRLGSYRRLPKGWAPAPLDIWTDLFMWRKFLAMEDFVFATRSAVTALHFAAADRQGWTLDERQEENRQFLERIRDPAARRDLEEAAWHSLLDRTIENEATAARRAADISVLTSCRDELQQKLKSIQEELKITTSRWDEFQNELNSVRSELERMTTSKENLRRELTRTRDQLQQMIQSRSWRLTAPLRALVAMLRRVRLKEP